MGLKILNHGVGSIDLSSWLISLYQKMLVMLRGINRQDIFEDDEDCMQISKFPQYLPPNVWKADVHWVSDEVGVAVTPTWHLPKTYLNTYLRNEGQKMVVTIVWEKCRFSPREMPFFSKRSGTSPYSKCHFAVLKVPFSLPKCATWPVKCATFAV